MKKTRQRPMRGMLKDTYEAIGQTISVNDQDLAKPRPCVLKADEPDREKKSDQLQDLWFYSQGKAPGSLTLIALPLDLLTLTRAFFTGVLGSLIVIANH